MCIINYDKWSGIKSWQTFANLPRLLKAKNDFLKDVESTVALCSDIAPNYKHMFGPLPYQWNIIIVKYIIANTMLKPNNGRNGYLKPEHKTNTNRNTVGQTTDFDSQGPVVQSVVSLTSSLRVISLTVLADSRYNILIFFAEKMWVAFALQKLLTFFQQKISAYLCISQCKF